MDVSDYSSLNVRQCIALNYRRIQLTVILCNECFQTCMWPSIEFVGVTIMISLLYSFVVCFGQLPSSGNVAIIVMLALSVCLIFLTLDLGSQTILFSSRILRRTELWNECGWSRRFRRSCQLTSFKIGDFHQMDKERVSSLVRFVLQRTCLLVFKTKLSNVNGSSIVVSLP